MKYVDILNAAKTIKTNVEKNYELGKSPKWSYYHAKVILNGKKDVPNIKIANAEKNTGNNLSRQVKRSVYLDMAERFVKYVEKNHQLPNNIKVTNKVMRVTDYCYMFANLVVIYSKTKALPKTIDVNSKAFIKPYENKNTVFTKWVNTFKFTPKYLDDVCDYILKHFTYLFYFDDVRSNAEVIEDKAGNCTDLLQMLINMAEALGYEWKVIHTQCKQSGTGHVYGMFRRKDVNNGEWFIRDIACIADESRYCVWCEVPSGGNLLATNPNWFMQNLRR